MGDETYIDRVHFWVDDLLDNSVNYSITLQVFDVLFKRSGVWIVQFVLLLSGAP